MTLAALLVHASADPVCEPRLRLAARLADDLDAALIGVGAEDYLPPPEALPWGYPGGPVDVAVESQIAEDLAAAQARFRAICGGVKKGIDWRAAAVSPARALALHSRAADLVLASSVGQGAGFIERRVDAAELVMTCGRPVLTGPAEADRLDLSRAVVAWKNTREARRAIADSLPILRRAERVLLVQAPEDGQEDASIGLADVAEALRRHGVTAAMRVLGSERPPAEAVLEACVDEDAQLIVAGAYGRARMLELVFGGVTRQLLQQKAKFVLLSH